MTAGQLFCQVEPVGRLRVLETYAYYDGPKLFACRNDTEQTFIAIWTEDGPAHDSWLLLPVSLNRFRMNPEDGFLFLVRTDKRTSLATAIHITPDLLSSDELPDAGQFLDSPEKPGKTAPPALRESA